MATQGYEAVFVLRETKKKLKVMCAKEGKTFDQKLQEFIKKANK